MRPEILLTVPIYAPTMCALEREFTVHKLWSAGDPDAFIGEIAGGVRGAVTNGLAGFSRRQIEALPHLEIIACFGTPDKTVDLAAAHERGVIVTNTPDSISGIVADLAIGLMLAVMRRICESDRFVRAGKWAQAGPMAPGWSLGGKTCGIVGLGRIGREIAKRAASFDMSVCYHGPRRKDDVPHPYYADLEGMARRSDCLVLACPATPATRNLVDARILDALGPDGFLVNVARGAVVDEAALIAALQNKRIAGAGLDVFRDEPRVPEALIGMEQVVLLPHMGSTTREIRAGRGEKVLANLRAHFSGKPVLHRFG
ncbi:MAG: 2-hydroxyacid dehydrogenase [Betaproteobacteria bacterium]|nr:2-hydroxyacid dehydrogenase [Betaproteobacteria bacterium]